MSGARKTTRYPPATAANGATAEAIAKALLAPLRPLPPKKVAEGSSSVRAGAP